MNSQLTSQSLNSKSQQSPTSWFKFWKNIVWSRNISSLLEDSENTTQVLNYTGHWEYKGVIILSPEHVLLNARLGFSLYGLY